MSKNSRFITLRENGGRLLTINVNHIISFNDDFSGGYFCLKVGESMHMIHSIASEEYDRLVNFLEKE